MKNILLIPNVNKDADLAVTRRVAALLRGCGARIYSQNEYSEVLMAFVPASSRLAEDIDLIIVVGGDGSMLNASRLAIANDIPVLGVNLGKVGYLSEVEVDNIEMLAKLFTGEYITENKMLLELRRLECGHVDVAERLAVNDIIISHENFLGIADFSLKKNGGETVRYRADGIIFSTPVGSTAYSLSAGGPIVAHNVNSIIVTPIAPHSFFDRSIIFDPSEVLTIKNDGDSELNISIDGRRFDSLKSGEECAVAVSEKTLKMITFKQDNMFATLFKKMRISEI